MFASVPSSTLTCKLLMTLQCGNLIFSCVRILVLPSGSVTLLIVVTDLDLYIVLKVFKRQSSSYLLISMLWVLHVCDPLLDHDLEQGVSASAGLVMSLGIPASGEFSTIPMALNLTHVLLGSATWTEMVLNTTFMTLFSECWAFLVCMCCTAFITGFAGATLSTAIALTFFTGVKCSYFIHCCRLGNSTGRLVSIEVLHGHFDVPWCIEVELCMSLHLAVSLNIPISLLQNVLLCGIATLCDVPWLSASVAYWHLSMIFFIHWSNWCVVSLLPCLMSLYILSIWFQ